MSGSQNYINHVALVLDASHSMGNLRNKVIEIADEQIAYLARRSKELDQETRVTVYVFASDVECVVYDKDVLRLPSIKSFYRTGGMTALIAATLKSQSELAQTAQLYGDHSFLTFVLTDGQENASHHCKDAPARSTRELVDKLASRMETLEDNWTVAILVPDQMAKREARQFGFPLANIAIWDATSTSGLAEAGRTIQQATETFMTNRAAGIRGSRSVFSTGADAVNAQTIRSAGLTPLDPQRYLLVHVTNDAVMRNPQIRDWVEKEAGHRYSTGKAFYELTKSEKIQPQKQVAIMDKRTKQVYSNFEARDVLGLPAGMEVRVKPDFNPDYSIFVQSTSTNRKLVGNTKVMLMV